MALVAAEKAATDSVMCTCPLRIKAWRISRTCHRIGARCCWWKWTKTTRGHRAAWCHMDGSPRGVWSDRRARPARLARGRLTASRSTSPRTPEERITSGASAFPTANPSRSLSGPTAEEGIAVAPDGRSLVTAVALSSTSLWLHDGSGERQISLEGNAVDARFTPDGRTLLYKVVNSLGTYPVPGELRVAHLATGRSEVMLPGFQVIDYDISTDGQHVVMEAADGDGTLRLWLARLDRRVPHRQIPNVEGRQPRFAPDGDILFRRSDGAATYVYRVRPDGTGMRKVIEQAIPLLGEVSPDGRFVVGWTTLPGSEASMAQLFPLNGGAPVPVASFISWSRSSSGGTVSFVIGTIADGRSYVVPLRPGETLPPMPAAGLRSVETSRGSRAHAASMP